MEFSTLGWLNWINNRCRLKPTQNIPPAEAEVRFHIAPSASMRDRIVPQPMAQAPEGESAENVPGSRPSTAVGSQMEPILPSPSNGRRRPTGGEEPDTAGTSGQQRHKPDDDARDPGFRERAGRIRGAALLQRVFELDALRCSGCGSTMRLLAAVEDPEVARGILECLELAARAPPLGKAVGPHDAPSKLEDDWFFDQSTGDDEP